jgi:beta-galactosidase
MPACCAPTAPRPRPGRGAAGGARKSRNCPRSRRFDYASAWAWETQPQGADYFRLVFEVYRGLRKLGLSVDILPPDTEDLGDYRLVMIPGLLTPSMPLLNAIARSAAQVILGPRTGAKTAALSIPVPLPPAIPDLDVTVARVETMRPDMPVPVKQGGHVTLWREDLEGRATVLDEDTEGRPVTVQSGNLTYLGGWPDPQLLRHILLRACSEAGIATQDLPPDIRIRQAGGTRFVFNHGQEPVAFEGRVVPPAGVIW